MALSLFNFFVLEQEEVRLPFFFIDCGILLIVAFQVSGLKAADEARNLEEKRAYAAKEAEKLALAAQKAEQRAAQRAQQVSEKGSKQNNIGGPTNPIHQPDKKKSN
uniref:Uncharacterized protein n=1 Tax=Amphora coffeiformis TaxID=265554 RepID=A0A7S3L958_9STRA|mmetsp:Transcript_8337/g.15890  ORF Transcript_8337/g.15890 Transcript_8337/m.15890 type:complete len:106 (+) Transcript_8337:118-435(+)